MENRHHHRRLHRQMETVMSSLKAMEVPGKPNLAKQRI